MKLIGLACGSEMDNTEVLVKEALMAAEEQGVNVEFIRLQAFNIKPCRGCGSCIKSLFQGGEGKCVIDDDLDILDEKIMECDGLILGSPVYTLAPTGQLKIVCDRFGPTHDVYARLEAKKLNDGKGSGPDERSFKDRVGAFISVGGGTKFVYMALPLMNLFTFPLQIKIVDQMQLTCAWYGSVVAREGVKTLQRAGKLGRNVARSMGKPLSEIEWMGDEPGTCPVCHSNMLIVTDKNPVVCPICGIRGHIRLDGENINVVFSREEQKLSHLTLAGLEGHWKELNSLAEKARQRSKIESDEELFRKLEKYRGYGE